MEATDKHSRVFLDEAGELLADLEAALLELEERPQDPDLVGRIFRAMHTIKGSGAMFGFDRVSKFTHELETVFDLVRSGNMAVSKELINLTLAARDRIKTMLDVAEGMDPEQDQANASLIDSLKSLVPPGGDRRPERPVAATLAAAARPRNKTLTLCRVTFRPSKDIFKIGVDPVLLLRELRGLGECTVTARTEAVPFLEDMDPEACYTAWEAMLATDSGPDAVRDVFLFVQDDSELTIEVVDAEDAVRRTDNPDHDKKLGVILLERGDVTREAVTRGLSAQKRLGQVLVELGAVGAGTVASALAEQEHLREAREKRRKEEAALSVRVPAEKLDKLVDLVGELVTVQARLSQAAASPGNGHAVFLSISEEVERLTAELRDNTMSIRMLPIGLTFSRFKRLVHDLSAELGKAIELTTEGAETELDKTVIERLGDPLVHLIRNSIDHGIESPDARVAAGKPRQGTIHLSAVHSGAQVLIRIRDDGAGIDPGAVRAKALERGLIAADAVLSERETYALLFAPGFSTAKTITSVSGRGVGMDVVKKTIDALRGSIDISSRPGVGTTVTLKLPLTLAIIDGFLTRIGTEHFVFPLSLVEECVALDRADREKSNGRRIADVRGRIVPYVRLRERFLTAGDAPELEQIVITRVDHARIGFVVDHIIGGLQTVIKNLGRIYQDADGVSGATILGDGTVALVLDVPGLARMAQREAAGRQATERGVSACPCGKRQTAVTLFWRASSRWPMRRN